MGCGGSKPSPVDPSASAPRSGAAQSGNVVDTSKSGKHFNELYKLGKELGAGAFSVVKEGSHKQSGESFAIKIVTKDKLSDEDEIALRDEIAVLKELNHSNIIMLYDVFDEKGF